MIPTRRPSAAEIVEVLGNNPRLVSPCIDVPLASVQVERTDSLEMIPRTGLATGCSATTEYTHMLGGGEAARRDSGMGDVEEDTEHGYLMLMLKHEST